VSLAGADSRPVVIFDSGVGGLPYLDAARAVLPGEGFAYVADRGGFPYGTKTREEVRERVLEAVEAIARALDPKALVIACNTASQAALEAVRKAHPGLVVVGTVPAVKPAAQRTRSGVIGVMATARAVEDPYLDELVARHAPGVRVLREAAQDLVAFVERSYPGSTEAGRRAAVEPYVRRLVAGGADEIVLACTHFLHVAADISAAAGKGVEVIDSRDGVARRLRQLLEDRGLLAPAGLAPPRGALLITGRLPFEESYSRFAASFGLDGPLPLPEGRPGPAESR
jgi:glutamate racemase